MLAQVEGNEQVSLDPKTASAPTPFEAFLTAFFSNRRNPGRSRNPMRSDDEENDTEGGAGEVITAGRKPRHRTVLQSIAAAAAAAAAATIGRWTRNTVI